MATLYRGEFFVVQYHHASGYVHLIRTAVPVASTTDVATEIRDCEHALGHIAASECGILLDWRLAPMSTDPKLHALIVKYCSPLVARFPRRAVLVATAVGEMQAGRIGRSSEVAPDVFRDLDVAVKYLTAR